MALNFEVVAKSPATTKAVGIPVSSEGALPKEVTLSRATLEYGIRKDLNFHHPRI